MASLAVSLVKGDDAGNVRLVKRGMMLGRHCAGGRSAGTTP